MWLGLCSSKASRGCSDVNKQMDLVFYLFRTGVREVTEPWPYLRLTFVLNRTSPEHVHPFVGEQVCEVGLLPSLYEGTLSDIFVNKATCLPTRGRHFNHSPSARKSARCGPTTLCYLMLTSGVLLSDSHIWRSSFLFPDFLGFLWDFLMD